MGIYFNKTKAYNYSRNPSAFDTYPPHPTAHNADGASFNRARAVIVPNAGGTAGISFRYADAKVSFGYRGDFFFGAMDGGIDTRKHRRSVDFHGPFATDQHWASVMGRRESGFSPLISSPVSGFCSWSARGRYMMPWDGSRAPHPTQTHLPPPPKPILETC